MPLEPEVEFKILSDFADTALKALALIAVGSYVLSSTVRFAGCNQGFWVVIPLMLGAIGALLVFYMAFRMIWLQNIVSEPPEPETMMTRYEEIYTSIFLILVGVGVAIVLITQFTVSNSSFECLENPIVGELMPMLEPK